VAHTDNPEPPVWSQDAADDLIGRYALVGVSWYAADGTTIMSRAEYHGRVTVADAIKGVAIECEGVREGEIFTLPPDLRAFSPAAPGASYTLKSTNEIVRDVDVLATWSVMSPKDS
jgi:hypothetical protein